jgi:acetyl-CoA C-acetyltransferase
MKLDAKVNVVAQTHRASAPGASGARIIVTLLNVLKQNNTKYGAANL